MTLQLNAHSRLPVERQSDQAFEALFRANTQCDIAPGELGSEPQLEQQFGFGRVPIRLAMDRLIQLQLVRPIHRRGYEIAPITLADVKNNFQLRLMVEPAAARLAAGKVDVEELRRTDEDAKRKVNPEDKSTQALVLNANRRLHLLIAEGCGNDKIVALLGQILNDIDRVFYFGLVRDVRFGGLQHDHRLLIDALEAGDGAKAGRLTRKHIEQSYEIVMDAIINKSNLAHTMVQAANNRRRAAEV
jgi:DNA-binding GntR family transcriptional regulator